MPTIAALIAHHRDEIVQSWTAEASRSASARGLHAPELLNIMPRYVDALGLADDPSDGGSERRRALIERHAAARLRQGFDVEEVLEELRVLGRTIELLWQRMRPEEQPSREEKAWLDAELQTRAAELLQLFRETVQQDAQVEKRYERQLRQIAADALRAGGSSLDEALSQMLELVREAMGAQSAALLLYEPATQRFVTHATAGDGREQMGDYVASTAAHSFAAKVAASDDEPTSILDVETTELEVSDALRHSGIHALLGVRLPPARELLGILYVGLSQRREFSPRERYLLELLGERLVLHLENARLFEAREAQLEQLRQEKILRERFVSVLAHDLRGPLSVAKLGTQTMIKNPAAATARVSASVLRNLERMERMISDLLDANRLRAGEQLPVSLEQVDVSAVARGVVDDLRELYGDRFVLQGRAFEQGYVDVDLLRRALWNLAVNAVKYGAAEAPIVIGVESDEARVRLTVHNEGNPISAADQRTLFQQYRRGSAVAASSQIGWGIGLSLVRGAATAHHGTVRFSSAPATGTTFTLELPRDGRSSLEQSTAARGHVVS